MRFVSLLVALTALGLTSTACHKNPDDGQAPASSAIPQPVPMAEKKPLDHAEKGALIEGTEKVYALPLPYGFHASSRTGPITVAYGEAVPRQVATYIQARVRDGSLVEREGTYIFSSVRMPSEPDRLLNIEIDHVGDTGAQLVVTDKTPPPDLGAANPLPVDRLKQVGLDSHGRTIDFAHQE